MKRRLALLGLIGLLVASLALGIVARWFRPNPEPPAWANEYDVTVRSPEMIAPGAVVESSAPAGWSHLVIKSLPRVRASEVSRVPSPFGLGREYTVRMASWMFTAFAADVVPERQGEHTRFRLRAIGLGLGTKINARDTIITPETASTFGKSLDLIEKEILTTGYKVQSQARVVVHGPSFALLDTPVCFRCSDKHRLVRYRYALLVEAPTGRLDVLLWRLGGEGGECADLTSAVYLAPNTVDESELIPDESEFNIVGGASDLAFAVDRLPKHLLQVALPEEIVSLAEKTRFTADQARDLEDGLRQLLTQARSRS
ncbi:MAG: hypothetical protein L0241_28645 [Planctomycetia bacterium]|nr:hypothetical protein [Planctomycetia bacterium]